MPANDPGAYFREPSRLGAPMARGPQAGGSISPQEYASQLILESRGQNAFDPAMVAQASPLLGASALAMTPQQRAARLQELLATGVTSLEIARMAYPYAPDKTKADIDMSIMEEYEAARMGAPPMPGQAPPAPQPMPMPMPPPGQAPPAPQPQPMPAPQPGQAPLAPQPMPIPAAQLQPIPALPVSRNPLNPYPVSGVRR